MMSTSKFWGDVLPFSPLKKGKEKGFGLVEMMVAMVIGLIGTVVIFQVFAVSEGQKRSTMSGGDAQFNGSFSMFTLDRDLKMAGAGIARSIATFGCVVSKGGSRLSPPSVTPSPPVPITVAPLVITDGGGGASDSIKVMYGNASGPQVAVALGGLVGGALTSIPLSSQESSIGMNHGDQVLAVQSGVDCAISKIQVAAPATTLPALGPVTLESGLGNNYSSDAVLLDLGPQPVMRVYGIRNNQLMMFDLMQAEGPANPSAIADGVVNLQAQYGIDTSATLDGVIDDWVEPTGLWAADVLTPIQISQIHAVRLGVVVRSNNREKTDDDNRCKVTTEAPISLRAVNAISGVSPGKKLGTAMPFDANGAAQDGCYRYKVYESVMPLRNVVWATVN